MEDQAEKDRKKVKATLLHLDDQFGISRQFPNRLFIVELSNKFVIFRNNEEGNNILIPATFISEPERQALQARQIIAESNDLHVTYETYIEECKKQPSLNTESTASQTDGTAPGGVDPNVKLSMEKIGKRISLLEKENKKLHSKIESTVSELREYINTTADRVCQAAYDRADSHKRHLDEKIANIIKKLDALKMLKPEERINVGRGIDNNPTKAGTTSRERCYNCGQVGHIAAVCKKPGVICYRCRQCEGHTSLDCPYTEKEVAILRRLSERFGNRNAEAGNFGKRSNQNESRELDAKRSKFHGGPDRF